VSSYKKLTFHPDTGIAEMAWWLDDYFGQHAYGVKFADGKVFYPSQVQFADEPLILGRGERRKRGSKND